MELLQIVLDKLSNSMRIYAENSTKFHQLRQVDEEEAINNLDRAFEAKLEAFHSVYDVTKDNFKYFEHVDTFLLIMLRNAIHHRDHLFFRSWNSEMHLDSGMEKYSGVAFLLVNHKTADGSSISEYYYKLEDILDRIDDTRSSEYIETKMGKKNRKKLMKLINNDLKINEILEFAESEKYPLSHVYLNIIPIFISAMSKLFRHFQGMNVGFKGFDSETYLDHFTAEQYVDLEQVTYKQLRLP